MKKEKGKFTLGDGESGIGIDEKDNEDCFFAIDTTVVRKGSYRVTSSYGEWFVYADLFANRLRQNPALRNYCPHFVLP